MSTGPVSSRQYKIWKDRNNPDVAEAARKSREAWFSKKALEKELENKINSSPARVPLKIPRKPPKLVRNPMKSIKINSTPLIYSQTGHERIFKGIVPVERIDCDLDDIPEVSPNKQKLRFKLQPRASGNSGNSSSHATYGDLFGQVEDASILPLYRVRRVENESSLIGSSSNFKQDATDNLAEAGDKLLNYYHTVSVEEDTVPSKSTALIGFKNFGNTCYINSTMQMLLGLPSLVDSLVMSDYDQKTETSNCELLRTFTRLCKLVKEGSKEEVYDELSKLKTVMEERDKQFVGNKMQDASEFLGRCLDEISEDFDSLKGDVNLVRQNYLHKVEETYTCQECGHVTNVEVNDIAIWCDVSSAGRNKRKLNLQELLESNFVSEEREKRCDECGYTTASLVAKMVRLPKILQIYLKRYNYGQLLDGKVKNYVEIPASINLSSISCSEIKTIENFSFASDAELLSSSVVPSQLEDPSSSIPTKSLVEEREDVQLERALNESLAEFNKTSKLSEKEDEDLQKALNDSLLNSSLHFIQEELEDSGSIKRNFDQMSDSGQDGKCRKSRKGDEEEDLRRAIELSKIDFKFSAPDFASSNPSLITNNNTIFYGDAKDPLDIEDGSKFNYQVCSIVSHHGSTATSGHYVADVLRFDPEVEGRWFRFDDDCVTETSQEKVLSGSNCYNGYIITYIQSST